MFIRNFVLPLIVSASMLQTASADIFGQPGQDGADGQSGQSQAKGSDLRIDADEQGRSGRPKLFISKNAKGYRGGDGTNADPGFNANDQDCKEAKKNYGRTRFDLEGARGGNAGIPGEGGDGGDGSDVTIEYSDISSLQKIYVNAEGGKGGRGGLGAYGGYGCECTGKLAWGRHGDYKCIDGQAGNKSKNAQDGKKGRKGRLFLIDKNISQQANNPASSFNISFRNIEQTFNFNKVGWAKRRGAKSLLFAGSKIQDEYSIWTEVRGASMEFVWNYANKAPSDFPNAQVHIEHNNGHINYTFPSHLWIDGNQDNYPNNHKVFNINSVIRPKAFDFIRLHEVEGNRKSTVFKFKDNFSMNSGVKTKFYFHTDWIHASSRNSTQRFRQYIPSHLVVATSDGFHIKPGALVTDRSLAGRAGQRISIKVERSLNGRSHTTDLGTIRLGGYDRLSGKWKIGDPNSGGGGGRNHGGRRRR